MEAAFPRTNRARAALFVVVVALSCFRLAHIHLLWADEDYHLAAAIQILHGKIPYRDFWYDKPPLSALYYLLIGGYSGWPLRVLDAAYILAACCLAYRLARVWWGPTEGWIAALLLAFFTTFYLPSAVIPFAADALMIVPHLAAVYCAQRRLPVWAGVWAGVAFLANAKGVFVLAVCVVWLWSEWPLLAAGFAIPAVMGLIAALGSGAWSSYVEQVWRWGLLYTEGSPVMHPAMLGVVRTADWLGFHIALAAGAAFTFLRSEREDRWKLGAWLALSFAAVCLGSRFAPHYFLQLLPPMIVAASRGFALALREYRKIAVTVLAIALLVPLIRFGPRYASLAYDDILRHEPRWSDVILDLDSRHAARQICSLAKPGDTLFVWGYRPDIYVYTRMVPDGLFWDSQPLTGVPADRHLYATTVIYSGPAVHDREQLTRSHPTFLVDGLGLLNPKLKPSVYPELRPWLAGYRLVERTKLCLIYRRMR